MIFIDTGAFLARYLPRDTHHARASLLWQDLGSTDIPLYTSNFVLDELFTLLGRRASHEYAASRAKTFYSSSRLKILRPTVDDEVAALDDFEKLADQKVSFTDCVSFALMRRRHITRAFSFDRHFQLAGFEIIGQNA
ncbi:MAG: type II toxin-antitoxin system VapC family toxin [Deltaproteobacteria bacterium]|nr:type II toxin-antitoxin system VapC family toxin [Deltaproteobacteria bacterium]